MNLESWIMLLSCRRGGGGCVLKCMYVFRRRLGHMMMIPSFSSSTTTTTTEQDLHLKHNTQSSSNVFSSISSFSSSYSDDDDDDAKVKVKVKVVYDSNIKISSLGRSRKVEEARYLFDKMPHRDIVSYASMITVYLKNGDLSNAENLFHTLPSSSSGSSTTATSSSRSNVVVSSAMIDAYAKASRMEDARRIFDQMPHTNVFTWTSLISGYLRIGQTDEAHRLFDRMPVKNVVSWTTMVLGYARNGLIAESRRFFDRMPDKNVIAWTTIVKAYVENNQIDQAKKLFDQMPLRNLYSWNIMITAYFDQNRVTEAIELFRLMPQRNAVSWTTMVTGLARNGMTNHARDYFDQIPKKDIAAWNAMITAYASDGFMIQATQLFNSMPDRNTVTWNAMIDGYSRNGPVGEALNHLILMLRHGYRPNETSVTSAVAACESMLELMQLHALALMLGFESETSLSNALITMYSRSGSIGAAKNIFEKLEFKDIVSWTAMILAYSNHGDGAYALQVFARMLRAGAKPDPITFVGVLSGCSHAGLLQKGKMLFDSMSRAYSLEPKAEHYSCLVDLLGRAGHINEAMKVVNQMPPSERDGAVLGSLLGACKLYGDVVGVADQIGEDWIELEPTSSGGYVLLANLYAARGRWDDFARLRKKMKERKVKKVPGFSQIEVKNMSYVFFVGDRSHPRVKEIYAVLKEMLLPQMMEMGYTHEDPSVVSG